MRSTVAEILREDTRARTLALSPAERVELALRLGDEDAADYAAFNGVSLEEARRRLSAARHLGRRPSVTSRLG